MRTKTLLLTAALSAAGVATSMAQVYSVNAVGYVNKVLVPGYNLVANPLDAADNTIPSIFAGVPGGTQVFVYQGGSFTTVSYIGAPLNTWSGDAGVLSTPIEPGDGVFVRNAGTTDITVTFVGEVPQGAESNKSVPVGLSIQGSPVPQSGALTADLGFPAANGDQVFIWDEAAQSYAPTYSYIGAPLNRWNPSEPTVDVGEAFFVSKAAAASWDRNFDINSNQ